MFTNACLSKAIMSHLLIVFFQKKKKQRLRELQILERTFKKWLRRFGISDGRDDPNGLYVDDTNNKLIVVSFGAISNPGGSIRVVDLQNRTMSSLGKEGTAIPMGGLDGVEADSIGRYYYVTDNTEGKLFVVNSNGTGYETLDLLRQRTADLGAILDQNMIIIPMIQDNKIEAFRIMRQKYYLHDIQCINQNL